MTMLLFQSTFILFTLGPAYNEFVYNEHPAITSRFLCIKLIDCNVKEFGYNEHSFIMSSSFCIMDPVHLFLSLSSETEFELKKTELHRRPLPIALPAVAYLNIHIFKWLART